MRSRRFPVKTPNRRANLKLRTIFSVFVPFCLSVAAACPITRSGAAEVDTLRIIGVPQDSQYHPFIGNGWTLYLDGTIDSDAARRFNTYILYHHVPQYSFVVLNSPGGNLLQGIELGRIFREHDFRTDVGVPNNQPPRPFDYGPGYCYSACTLAYLGGHFRYLKYGSRYGVHRFSFPTPSANDVDAAQINSAVIIEYLRSMNIDSDFFTTMTQTSPSDIVELPTDILKRLKVVNFGYEQPGWTIESNEGAIYLKGQRDTVFGLNKFILSCSSGYKVLLYIVIDTQGHDNDLMGFSAHSLVVDNKEFPIQAASKFVNNGLFNSFYALSKDQVSKILNANEVGVIFQQDYGAPFMLGFDSMPFAGGRDKFNALINLCEGKR
jgi:hypothetical protein